LQRTKARRVECPPHWIEPGNPLVVALYILLAGRSFHKAGAKHISLFEQPQQGIFSGALDARPGHSSLLTTVGTRARHVAKGHLWIQFRQQPRHVQGEVVGIVFVFIFAYADGRYAETKKARVEST